MKIEVTIFVHEEDSTIGQAQALADDLWALEQVIVDEFADGNDVAFYVDTRGDK